MRKKTLVLLYIFLMLGAILLAQETTETGNTLDDQFTDVIDNSNRYQDYKVVKIYKLNALKKSVMDSLAAIEKDLNTAQDTIAAKDNTIGGLSANLKSTQDELAVSREKENGISLFGILLTKSTYNTIMWSSIGLLLLLLVVTVVRFRQSNAVTRESKLKLAEVEEEYEDYRQRTLDREQQLRRKLQDEINKQKKN
ncbi:tRNA (guanine-N1)-methyltransferase [Aureitalea marina]|uniref:tRNA (Guanine-N1)-methyltransferase n=1 Tax=Aureitalea marina TaxID=930804 RepID=A0A2S7KPJ0_9FLAO|nr:tRNA (guanine-N1)-methyltransferase [Aureitalea marina]PQB04535.1 hypothetical protein BST85_06180 [Aureitalea marina]